MRCASLFSCEQVQAKGSPDVALDWMFDMHLSIGKLMGRLCGAILDITSGA